MFHNAAQQMVPPVILEAQGANPLTALHLKLARKLSDRSQKALTEILAAVPK
jgi:hypothetical protein